MRIKITIILGFILFGCSTNKFKIESEPTYERISDPNYWNVQYFDIRGYSSTPDSILIEKIIEFSQRELSSRNIMPPKIDVQNFYDKKWYRPACNDISNLNDETIDGDAGLPRGCGDLLIGDIHYNRIDSISNTYTRTITIWHLYDSIPSRDDTLKIVGNEWMILKQGKIERK